MITTIDYTGAPYRPRQMVRFDGLIGECPACHRQGAMLKQHPLYPTQKPNVVWTHIVTIYDGSDSPALDGRTVRVLTQSCIVDPPANYGTATP